MATISRQQLDDFFAELLQPHSFRDYGPNGLQIEGSEQIAKIAFAVSATGDSIQQACTNQADALVVHHGLFWSFKGTQLLTGSLAKRVFPLVKEQINLFGYHLPLDAHLEVGNAASLARLIGLRTLQPFGDYKGCYTGVKGRFEEPVQAVKLQQRMATIVSHPVMIASFDDQAFINSVGIITGGANNEWPQALSHGLDAYITGEMSEHNWHDSKEAGVHMFAGGHHATERFGIQSLMTKTKEHFDIECFYIDSDNPA